MVSSVNNVGTISSAGLGSGLDVASIVSQLMKLERKPLDALEASATKLNAKVSTFGKLQSYFSALRDKSQDLTSTTLWSAMIAVSGDATAVKVAEEKLGVKDASGKIARFQELVAKWTKIVDEANGDVAAITAKVQEEVWDKVDYATYGL